MSLYWRQLPIGPMGNFTYLVGDTDAKQCWVVDPAWAIDDILAVAKSDSMTVVGALLTHSHYDHCNAVDALLTSIDMPIYAHKREMLFREKGGEAPLFPALPTAAIKQVDDGDVLQLGATKLNILHTPGHTPGSQCFLIDNHLITGDTLFLGSCGRCDLAGGNPEELFDSLNNRLSRLPNDTVIWPGHNYEPTATNGTLAQEKSSNRFLQAQSRDVFFKALVYNSLQLF